MARALRIRTSFAEWSYADMHPEEIWEPGYPAYDWCVEVTGYLEAEAKRTAPGRPGTSHARRMRTSTGRLRAGITAFGHRTGLESYRVVLNSSAPYSEFVHGGTAYSRGAHIYSTMGWANRAFVDSLLGPWFEGNIDDRGMPTGEGRFHVLPIPGSFFMKLPPGAGFSRKYHLRVRGQLANAFLYRAWNRTNDDLARGEMGSFAMPVGFTRPSGAYRIAKSRK